MNPTYKNIRATACSVANSHLDHSKCMEKLENAFDHVPLELLRDFLSIEDQKRSLQRNFNQWHRDEVEGKRRKWEIELRELYKEVERDNTQLLSILVSIKEVGVDSDKIRNRNALFTMIRKNEERAIVLVGLLKLS